MYVCRKSSKYHMLKKLMPYQLSTLNILEEFLADLRLQLICKILEESIG
jgi:hypothetical protein